MEFIFVPKQCDFNDNTGLVDNTMVNIDSITRWEYRPSIVDWLIVLLYKVADSLDGVYNNVSMRCVCMTTEMKSYYK